jgi:hypothetical protein
MDRRELAHKWAAQSRPQGRAGNIFFEGPTIYSYGHHFPIATIHTRNRRGGTPDKLVLFTVRNYSVTTTAHKGAAYGAVTHLRVCEVPELNPRSTEEHRVNFNALVARSTEPLVKARRANTTWRVGHYREECLRILECARWYCEFFGLRRKVPAFPEVEFNAAAARAERIENPNPALADKREREKVKRQAVKIESARIAAERRAIHIDAQRTNWRLGGVFQTGGYAQGDVMLRVNGAEIETSRGARIPLNLAPKVWALVECARAKGGKQFREGLARPITLGDYTVNEVTAEGDLIVGCHTIPHSELRAMARQLKIEGS